VNILLPSAAVYENPRWRVLNTFDWYSPKYQWAHSIEEVFAWFEEAGLEKIWVLPAASLGGSRPPHRRRRRARCSGSATVGRDERRPGMLR
jgi:hypothetical protein